MRRSEKMARKMMINSRIAQASGGLLIFLSVPLGFYEAYLFAATTLIAGSTLLFIGKAID
ncbi:hypothetical protein [Pseudodesulfovibrio profundus]|nr:hypothetical protein [Pseudodesulfovibrio profundus]